MSSSSWIALLRREWMQHRFAWAVMAVLPALLACGLLAFGQIAISGRDPAEPHAVALTMAALAGGMGLYLVMMWITSIIIVTGLARRDHADRSIEFWLSLPTGHGASLGVPLVVHLLLAPIAALFIGLLGGLVASALLVTRVEGFSAWLAVPWPAVALAILSVAVRLAFGLVLGTLWIAPLILATVLLTAWFRRWGLVILAVGLGLGSQVLRRLLGQPVVSELLETITTNAGLSVAGASRTSMVFGMNGEGDAGQALLQGLATAPHWALNDASAALQLAFSPVFAGGLLFAAACFAGLVQWRRSGAGS